MVSTEALNAIKEYFSCLEYIGYKSYSEVYKLLSFLFIEEILEGPMSEFVSEGDYNSLNNFLYCLYESCMIPYPSYLKGMEETRKNTINKYRYTEDAVLREAGPLRIVL